MPHIVVHSSPRLHPPAMVKPVRPQAAVEIALPQRPNCWARPVKNLTRFTEHKEEVLKGETKTMTTTVNSAETTSAMTAIT